MSQSFPQSDPASTDGDLQSVARQTAEIRVRGKTIQVPSLVVGGVTFVVTGRWVKTASLKDEALIERYPLKDPSKFIAALKQHRMADIFTFGQSITDPAQRHAFRVEWDNAAIIPISTYDDWWDQRLPQESRRNVRRAAKKGVDVRLSTFDDALVEGIKQIYDETPVRQGRQFWHYGKPFDAVKLENGTFSDRSDFIGAYLNEELIGYIKMIYTDRVAFLSQIICKNAHQDSRPVYALLAEAVRLCVQKGMTHLVHGKYVYGDDRGNSLTEFKRRNGFEELRYPRYFVPLTSQGKMAMALNLHQGIRHALPPSIVRTLLGLRSWYYRSSESKGRSGSASPGVKAD